MLERIKEYFERRMVKRILKQSASDIFTQEVEFDALSKKYASGKKGVEELLVYCILEVASYRKASTLEGRINEVSSIYLQALQTGIKIQSIRDITEFQKIKAQKQFLNTKLQRMHAKALLSENEYSIESMHYKLEVASRGPLTQEQYELIMGTHVKLLNIENKIKKIENRK